MSNDPKPRETITVRRRRTGASDGPSGTAQMPSRPRQGSGGTGGGFGGGGGGGGLGGLPIGGKGGLSIGAVILLAACYLIYTFVFGGGGGGNQADTGLQDQPTAFVEQPTEPAGLPIQPSPTARKRATAAPGGSKSGQTWTVMLYQDADDQVLEQDIFLDLNEVERVGSTDQVQIVAQIDRYKGAFTGDGDWTSTRRYHILKDNNLNRLGSELIDDIGEADMADGRTLTDFIQWAAAAYPADHYALILSDHGMGWPGGWSDGDPKSADPSRAPLASALSEDNLYMNELEKSLASALKGAGIQRLDLIGMDACLMGHLEVLAGLQPYASYSVLSQETEPALGWAYTGFLQSLVDNPGMDGAELGSEIVRTYIQDDQRINDDQARADYLRQGSPLGGLFGGPSAMSASALAQQMGRSATLTAVNMDAVPALMDAVNSLAYALQSEDQQVVAQARTYAPAFTNIFGKDSPSPYIDLGGFVTLLKRNSSQSGTDSAADQVLAALQQAVVAEKHGPGKPGATGVSLYFPNSTLYRTPYAGPQSYTAIADRFAAGSLWDDFLAFHYNDIGFDKAQRQPVSPQPGAPSRAPGAGQITLSEIRASGSTAGRNNPVTLSVDITGNNIGYIYFFAGYYDPQSNSIFKADTDYLESLQTQEVNGVYYPVWSKSGDFTMQFDWEPTLFEITDGRKSEVALFNPQTYGADPKSAVYTVDGIYNFANGDAPRSARLYFRDGVMRQVFGFNDANQTGGVWEITPQTGDTFTVLEKWLDLDQSGQVTQSVDQEGAVLTFGDQPFKWQEVYAGAGTYVVGFIVEDLDGNTRQVFTQIKVQ